MAVASVICETSGVEDADTCRRCGGACCRGCAGMAHPDDFGGRATMADVIANYLRTGFWAVDYWEADPRPHGPLSCVYFVRPAHVNAVGKLVDASWGDTCRLWCADSGCSLAFRNRPYCCRTLVPEPDDVKRGGGRGCTHPPAADKEVVVRAWIPYQDCVEAALAAVRADKDT